MNTGGRGQAPPPRPRCPIDDSLLEELFPSRPPKSNCNPLGPTCLASEPSAENACDGAGDNGDPSGANGRDNVSSCTATISCFIRFLAKFSGPAILGQDMSGTMDELVGLIRDALSTHQETPPLGLLEDITEAAIASTSQHTLIVLAILFDRLADLEVSSARLPRTMTLRKGLAEEITRRTHSALNGAIITSATARPNHPISGKQIGSLIRRLLVTGSLLSSSKVHETLQPEGQFHAALLEGVRLFIGEIIASKGEMARHMSAWTVGDTAVLLSGKSVHVRGVQKVRY